jgi:hypothetical protein
MHANRQVATRIGRRYQIEIEGDSAVPIFSGRFAPVKTLRSAGVFWMYEEVKDARELKESS